MRHLLHIAFVLVGFQAMSQVTIPLMDPFNSDTTIYNKRTHHAIGNSLTPGKDSLNKLYIQAATDSYFKYDSTDHFRADAGFNLVYHGKKLYSKTQALFGWNTISDYTQIQAAFQPLNQHQQQFFTDIRSRTAYRVNSYLTIQGGIDNQFIGEGYRSLIQGTQVAPNPFVSFQVKFLNLEYGLTYQFLHENDFSKNRLDWKYMTSHYLSWNAFRNFNLTLYECVIYQSKDGPYKRGYEIEYLNPFVFYRPQEYSLGSTDNVFISLQSSYRMGKQTAYFQLSLDEFDLSQIKNRTRWWANKYGFQLGIKGKIAPNARYILETNLVRPYTYSHITSGQNTGNLGIPTGHYLGSNFVEILATTDYQWNKLHVQAYGQFYLKGFDVDSLSYGGNIYQSYVNHPKEFDNTIGQGSTRRYINAGLVAIYDLPWSHLKIYGQIGGTLYWGENGHGILPNLVAGIRTNLFGNRRAF